MKEDGELMRRVQSGDEAALGMLMDRWELPVKGLLMRFMHNGHEAADLAQDTFVRVWEQRARFRAGADFKPWLFSIAVNLARNRLRWWRRRPEVTLDAWSGAGETETSAGRMERKEQAMAVRDAISELPRDLRTAVILAEFEGLSQAEIAQVTGTTTKAVESRLYRARTTLRKSLAHWMERGVTA
ncbi:MAG: sigma-70 family RNA polymerase sigma factor [Cephaloticoccus sp.]|nr:sigma-70 family RNA polymerase sigma factor [Cephaloticoccus sp.]MCF7760547.1 sigma-70 family RNA polymerase sigma factor [Cephaloticoccus sp.]